MGKPVKLTVGEYTNLKLTTPEDMIIAETILRDRGEPRRRLVGVAAAAAAVLEVGHKFIGLDRGIAAS